MTENNNTFPEMWALVELMGHTKVAGRISEETHFGAVLMRCDIPLGNGSAEYFTQWFGGNAIFRITPIQESTARAFAGRSTPQPVRPYEISPLPALESPARWGEDDDFEDDES